MSVKITIRKSHTGFRLVPTSVTLSDLERHNSPYFVFFSEFSNFAGRLCHSIMSAGYCLPVPFLHFWPKLSHPAGRSLSNSWASCCDLQRCSFSYQFPQLMTERFMADATTYIELFLLSSIRTSSHHSWREGSCIGCHGKISAGSLAVLIPLATYMC